MSLVEPLQGRQIPGLQIPHEFYWVLTAPAPLAGMRYPCQNFPWPKIAAVGFSGVVSLHSGAYDPVPLYRLHTEELEDLIHGDPPADSDHEIRAIRRAVSATVDSLRCGKGVVIHCCGGRGRTGTVLGCVLRELDYAAESIVEFLDRVHKARGKAGWPESSWQAGLVQSWASGS